MACRVDVVAAAQGCAGLTRQAGQRARCARHFLALLSVPPASMHSSHACQTAGTGTMRTQAGRLLHIARAEVVAGCSERAALLCLRQRTLGQRVDGVIAAAVVEAPVVEVQGCGLLACKEGRGARAWQGVSFTVLHYLPAVGHSAAELCGRWVVMQVGDQRSSATIGCQARALVGCLPNDCCRERVVAVAMRGAHVTSSSAARANASRPCNLAAGMCSGQRRRAAAAPTGALLVKRSSIDTIRMNGRSEVEYHATASCR